MKGDLENEDEAARKDQSRMPPVNVLDPTNGYIRHVKGLIVRPVDAWCVHLGDEEITRQTVN